MGKASQPRPVTIDFETEGVKSRPEYPPEPVGVSIKWPGKKPTYYHWGHHGYERPELYKKQTIAELKKAYAHKGGLLCHHGKFDLDVAETHLGLKPPEWQRCHDTLYLLYLNDPHAKELGLKPSAELHLGMAPEEQDAVAEWLLERQPVPGVKLSKSRKSEHYWAGYISWCDPAVVGPYANGDVERTEKLFELLYPKIVEAGMEEAYDRERRLQPVLIAAERRGVAVDRIRLAKDFHDQTHCMDRLDAWLRDKLDSRDANLDSGEQLVAALNHAKLVDLSKLGVTDTGKPRSDKDALEAAVSDKVVLGALLHRASLKTCLNTFMEPWLRLSAKSGRLHTSWQSTRSEGFGGTRTGRLASSPNLQNVINEFKPFFKEHAKDKALAAKLPRQPVTLLPLPRMRTYLVASKGHALGGRDFASQELRVLAHFENGTMMEAYKADPAMDFHQRAADLINEATGMGITRKDAKTIAFGILYGLGLGGLAERLGTSVDEAKKIRASYLNTFPGIKELMKQMTETGKRDEPIVTWGGRLYRREPSKLVNGRMMDFSYKLINYEIQGSSSDLTKESMIEYAGRTKVGHLLMSVHDELVIEVPKKHIEQEMELLKACMNADRLDVPMLSDGETGPSWGEMVACD